MLRVVLAAAAMSLMSIGSQAAANPPLYDPIILNIGINCQWQQSCQRRQVKAMKEARRHIAKVRPPVSQVQLCNRNARRGPARVDWVGFNNCIRNRKLRR